MHQDVVDLRAFYESGLGLVAQRMIRRQLRRLWPDVHGQSVLGFGYATPFLKPFVPEAERVFAVMPARQGVMPWPAGEPSRVALAEDTALPFPDMSIDRVLLVHGLEHAEDRSGLMREIWRVLSGSGRLMVVVPNRRGIWARFDRTPFGHGQPYSGSQLSRMLRTDLFVPAREARALFIPPFRARFLLAAATAWEELGQHWFSGFAGVVMIEASKQIYQLSATRAQARQRRRVLVPMPGTMAPARHAALRDRPRDCG
ncbi:MAG: methyltransferase domain-containing protein [Rhodospirillaceae bacterium]|nr:methyltransferase domain-containing protein [Rhodospirillaceae bacterium]